MQGKDACDGLKKCLHMRTKFPCGGSKYNTGVVDDLNWILLHGLN